MTDASATNGTVRVTRGGAPTDEQWAALVAACALVVGEGAAPPDPLPPAYRSRWRRAALLENTEIPVGIKDNGPAWGGTA